MPIQEQSPFSPRWYSHKLNGPGLRYEIGISLVTGWIIWVNGPYPAGEFNDLQITRLGLLNALDHDKYFLADWDIMTVEVMPSPPQAIGPWWTINKQLPELIMRCATADSRIGAYSPKLSITASIFMDQSSTPLPTSPKPAYNLKIPCSRLIIMRKTSKLTLFSFYFISTLQTIVLPWSWR